MRQWLLDRHGRPRNGVWMLMFVALFLLSRIVYRPLAELLRTAGAPALLLSLAQVALLLAVTWLCLRARRQPLAAIGLRVDRRFAGEAGVGFALGAGSALLAAGLMWLAGVVHWQLDPQRSAVALGHGLLLFAGVAVLEELLFRGFLFQRLVDGIGFLPAQLFAAAAFALAHWGNPDLADAIRPIATLELALAALLLGLAWYRSGSLALPIGIHLGWNWLQGQVLGFDVSGFAQAGWWQPVLDGPAWLTGAGFGLEGSIHAPIADLLVLLLLWRWRGSTGSRAAGRVLPATAT